MGVGQITKWRKQGVITWTAFAQTQRTELRGGLPLRSISLMATGQLDNTGGTTDGVAATDAPGAYVGGILIQENGGKILHHLGGAEVHDLMQARYKVRPDGAAVAGGDAANQTWRSHYMVDFALPRPFAFRPDDSIYQAANKIITIEAALGGAKTQGAGSGGFFSSDNDRTVAFDNASMEIEVEEVDGLSGANELKGTLVPSLNHFRDVGVSTSTRFQRKLSPGAVYRFLMFKTLGGTAAANTSFNPLGTILNNLSIESGKRQDVQAIANGLRARAKLYGQQETVRAGVYYHDFTGPSGQTSEMRNTENDGDFSIFYDVTKPTNQLDIITATLEFLAAA